MKPYYSEDGIDIFLGDCRDVLPNIEGDVLVTDPPYGTQFTEDNPRGGYGRRQDAQGRGSAHAPATPGMGAWIANDDTTEIRDEVLGAWDGPALIFASPRLPEPPGEWDHRLVWDKTRPGMNGGPWRYRHESIFVRGEWERISDSAVSVLTVYPDQSAHIHAKPLKLMVALVGAAPAGIVLDPFMGSGTTLRAAKDLGRKAVGIEIEERYCEIAAERLAQEVLDLGAAA